MTYKLLVCDIDGTLTDGKIILDPSGSDVREFNCKDGLVMRRLPDLGINVLLLTGNPAPAGELRAKSLNCEIIDKSANKKKDLSDYIEANNLTWSETIYVGDDLNDYGAMLLCGFKACPADAAKEIREICDYVSPLNGGFGVVRDTMNLLLVESKAYDAWLDLWR